MTRLCRSAMGDGSIRGPIVDPSVPGVGVVSGAVLAALFWAVWIVSAPTAGAAISTLGTSGSPNRVASAAAGHRSTDPSELQELISATPEGETLRLEARRYDGGVVVDRSMTIEGREGTVIDGGGRGTVISIEAPDVTLRNMEIRGSGPSLPSMDSAVYVEHAPRFTIEDTRIRDSLFGVNIKKSPRAKVLRNDVDGKEEIVFTMRGDGIRTYQSPDSEIIGNTVTNGRDVITFFSERSDVIDNVIEDGRYGLHIMYSNDVMVRGNRMLRNSTALYVMYAGGVHVYDNVLAFSNGPSAYGMTAKESDIVEIRGTRIVGNRVGIYMDSSPWTPGSKVLFNNNVVAYNIVGVLLQPSVHGAQFTNNAFIDNQEQVAATTGGSLAGNDWTIDGIGNHWSDYAGYDGTGDGIGDIPYRAEGLYDSITGKYPQLSFFSETPAARALDAAARAFPSLRPEPKAVDEAPLIEAPTLPSIEGIDVGSSRALLVVISVAMLGLAAMLVHRGTRPLMEVST